MGKNGKISRIIFNWDSLVYTGRRKTLESKKKRKMEDVAGNIPYS